MAIDTKNIGIKHIDTKVLSTSVQKNFELIKDGTGKALLQLEGLLNGIFGSLKELINTALNFISGVVDMILSIVNAVINFIKQLINFILGFIRDALNLLIGKLCMLLSIPTGRSVSIVVRTMSYMRKSLSGFGALLSSKANLINNYKIPDMATLFVTDALNTSLVAGILSSNKWSKTEYESILDNLVESCGLTTVVRGLRQMFASGNTYEPYYYESFYSIAERYFKDMPDGGTQYEIFQLLNNKQFIQLDYLKRYAIKDYDSLYDLYRKFGLDSSNMGYLIDITKMPSLDDLIPKPHQGLSFDVDPAYVESQVGDDYTLFEQAALIRNGGSTIIRKPTVYDNTTEGIISYKKNYDSFKKYITNKYPMATDKDLDVTQPYNLSNPMTFSVVDYKSSISVDDSTTSEAQRVQSICGIKGVNIEENTRIAEFEGFTNKFDVEVINPDNILKYWGIKDSKYTDVKIFQK